MISLLQAMTSSFWLPLTLKDEKTMFLESLKINQMLYLCQLIRINTFLTFSGVYMSCFVERSFLKIIHQKCDAFFSRCYEVYCFHVWHWLPPSLESLHNCNQPLKTALVHLNLTCYSLGWQLMHLDRGVEDFDAELVHHQDPPLDLVGLLVVAQHIA